MRPLMLEILLAFLKASMNKTIYITYICLFLGIPANAESLCNADEIKLFQCGFDKIQKSVSICQSKISKRAIKYRFGRPNQIELELPNKKSGNPFIHFEQFGPAPSQWIKSINFPNGKLTYELVTPQGISAILLIDKLQGNNGMACESGDNGNQIRETYEIMEKLKFKKK